MSVSLLVGAVFGASGIATAAQPLPPVHPPQVPPAKVVLTGVLSGYVAPTATKNGSVNLTMTSYRGARPVAKLTVVLTPQTVIKGIVVNGQIGTLHVQRGSSFGGWQRLVALKLVTFAQATPVNPDPPADDWTPVDPGPPADDGNGNVACGEEECAAP